MTADNVGIKCAMLFDRRISQVFSSHVKWSTYCYNACIGLVEEYGHNSILISFIETLQKKCVEGIINSLIEGRMEAGRWGC